MKDILWTSKTIWVDIDTGEQIRYENRKKYIIIKTIKHAEVNNTIQRGHIEYTKQCRRNPQLKIF